MRSGRSIGDIFWAKWEEFAFCEHERIREMLVGPAQDGPFGPSGPCRCCHNTSQLRVREEPLCRRCERTPSDATTCDVDWSVQLTEDARVALWFTLAASGYFFSPAETRHIACDLLIAADIAEQRGKARPRRKKVSETQERQATSSPETNAAL